MTYDPNLRRDTPLALKLKQRIREHGPIPVAQYMSACLSDPEHGYYVHREAIGRDGDFITAPEISQIFGEIIGLWCAVVWAEIGKPDPIHLVELGPGRGTMMRDMLRAMSRVPDLPSALRVTLNEPSPRLRTIQIETLKDAAIAVTHAEPSEPPPGPAILVANEVMDCVPIDQLIRCKDPDGKPQWHVRTVELDGDDRLQFGKGRSVQAGAWDVPGALPGEILEGGRTRLIFESLARHYAKSSLAALFLDYGHTEHTTGDTLQAIRAHAFEHPLTSPGEADLTAQVNFAQAAAAVAEAGLTLEGPVTQAEFLGRLGIIERASRLMSANPAKAAAIEASVARLIAPNGMGTRFKVIGVRSPHLAPLPGFA